MCGHCRGRCHGDLCQADGCTCTCRAVLGLAGPFEYDDPTAPDAIDRLREVA
jgi:hypothetical protein